MSARTRPRASALCSICDNFGHYARTCPIPQVGDEAPEHAKPMPLGPLSRCVNNCGAMLWARDKPTHECQNDRERYGGRVASVFDGVHAV